MINKSKINNELDPKISALREELENKLIENENYWNDKIEEKEKELILIIRNNSSVIENLIIKEQERKRNEFKSKSILAGLREQIEEKYLKDLAAVVAKIEELKNNK